MLAFVDLEERVPRPSHPHLKIIADEALERLSPFDQMYAKVGRSPE